jgi:hypothetical protein
MKKLIVLLSFLCLALSACASPGAIQQPTATQLPPTTTIPTNTPAPTNTPEPTATLVPTDTPTPEPTATSTPDKAATRAAEATQVVEQAEALIQKDLDKIDQTLPPGSLGWIQTQSQSIDMNGGNQWIYDPFAEDLVANDFILKTDITWESTGGLALCGFYFRSEPNFEQGEQYLFEMIRLSGLPGWDIALWKYGNLKKAITKMHTASAIDQGQGATNEVILFAQDGQFTLYINDERIGQFFDYTEARSDGYFAFDAMQESGDTTCTFDNTWVWLLDEE